MSFAEERFHPQAQQIERISSSAQITTGLRPTPVVLHDEGSETLRQRDSRDTDISK